MPHYAHIVNKTVTSKKNKMKLGVLSKAATARHMGGGHKLYTVKIDFDEMKKHLFMGH